MRYSRQREVIEGILNGNTEHPTADAVYLRAREIEPNISLGTVYRNLKSLAEEGKIITLETQDKKIHYDFNVSPHAHFMCERCGRVLDIFLPDNTEKELERKGVKVKSAKRVYYGVCGDCAEN